MIRDILKTLFWVGFILTLGLLWIVFKAFRRVVWRPIVAWLWQNHPAVPYWVGRVWGWALTTISAIIVIVVLVIIFG